MPSQPRFIVKVLPSSANIALTQWVVFDRNQNWPATCKVNSRVAAQMAADL